MMNAEDREQFYDRDIAPKLLELALACESNGISMACVADFGGETSSTTVTLQAGSPVWIRLVYVAMRARENVDALFFAIMKHAREHGHNSIMLSQLGIPQNESV